MLVITPSNMANILVDLPRSIAQTSAQHSGLTGVVSRGRKAQSIPENRKVMPRRPTNAEQRARECLTRAEIERLMNAARSIGRHSAGTDRLA